MKNNKVKRVVPSEDDERIMKAQNRVLRAYSRLGNWRAVGVELGLAHRYVYELGTQGIVPSNPVLRMKLFLPRIMPSERMVHLPMIKPLLGGEDWERVFFRAPRKFKSRRKPKLISGR